MCSYCSLSITFYPQSQPQHTQTFYFTKDVFMPQCNHHFIYTTRTHPKLNLWKVRSEWPYKGQLPWLFCLSSTGKKWLNLSLFCLEIVRWGIIEPMAMELQVSLRRLVLQTFINLSLYIKARMNCQYAFFCLHFASMACIARLLYHAENPIW